MTAEKVFWILIVYMFAQNAVNFIAIMVARQNHKVNGLIIEAQGNHDKRIKALEDRDNDGSGAGQA